MGGDCAGRYPLPHNTRATSCIPKDDEMESKTIAGSFLYAAEGTRSDERTGKPTHNCWAITPDDRNGRPAYRRAGASRSAEKPRATPGRLKLTWLCKRSSAVPNGGAPAIGARQHTRRYRGSTQAQTFFLWFFFPRAL